MGAGASSKPEEANAKIKAAPDEEMAAFMKNLDEDAYAKLVKNLDEDAFAKLKVAMQAKAANKSPPAEADVKEAKQLDVPMALNITVVLLDGSQTTLELSETATIDDTKRNIHKRLGFAEAQQSLSLGDRMLTEGSCTLQAAGVEDQSQLTLVIKYNLSAELSVLSAVMGKDEANFLHLMAKCVDLNTHVHFSIKKHTQEYEEPKAEVWVHPFSFRCGCVTVGGTCDFRDHEDQGKYFDDFVVEGCAEPEHTWKELAKLIKWFFEMFFHASGGRFFKEDNGTIDKTIADVVRHRGTTAMKDAVQQSK
eukprot:TRINITY_DN11002_c0_g1_i1.p1 TRINITY_DN11002_c0_g1~~TRINITY_DN11002_c0_g1_i1.p1  ORF type:complete len:307 (+),score=65.04 TRINITY_DN11002_c0_g1_i1:115-1035(+)